MKKPFFDHEKLDVYQLALEFVVSVSHIVKGMPKGKAYLADQLKRASSSIPMNIAEGAGEYSGNEKVRFYRMAKRSATECASILDICHRLSLMAERDYAQGREQLIRIVSMQVASRKSSSKKLRPDF